MKITKEQFKGIVKEVMIDESEYQEFFKRALEKAGKSIPDMSDEEKKAFFNKIDAAWDGKGEKKNEGNAFGAAVTKAKEEGDDEFEVDGEKFKVESVNESRESDIIAKIEKLRVASNAGKITGDQFLDKFFPLWKELKSMKKESIDEAMASGAWVGIEKTPKGPKLVKTFKSGNEAKAWVMKSPGGHSIMTKKQWDVSEGTSVNEAKYPTSLYVNSIIYGQGFTGLKGIEGGKYYKVVEMDDTTATLAPCDQKGKITGSKKVRHKLSSLEGGIKTAKRGDENGIVIESVNEASKKPTIKVVNKLKNEQGIQIVVTKTTKGDTMYGGFVVRGKLQKVIPVGANNSKEGVQKRALQIWDEFGKQLGESVNEAGNDGFNWPPVLDKFKGKEIDKVEAEYKASLDKSSAILDKQRQLIRTTLGNKFEFPWENYDKWPAKLKAEVQKLNSQIDKEREKQPAMFKKLMQARGTWR